MSRILVLDDEEMIRSLAVSCLSELGHDCTEAASAEQALELLAGPAFDLALLDINLPGQSGVEFLRQLKAKSPDTASIMVTAVDDLATAMYCVQLGADDYIPKPYSVERLKLSAQNALDKGQLLKENLSYQANLERRVQEQTEQIRSALNELQHSYEITLTALAKALDTRETEVGAHAERVRDYTSILARDLGVEGPQLAEMARGALLHDIGKIGVSDNILLKPGRLTEEEWVAMRRHPQQGFDIIANIDFLAGAAQTVLSHHERFDGQGYPAGLKGEEIPLGARIFAVVDTLDAMTSDRPYRKALPFEAVIDELKKHCGSQFDPAIVEAFLATPRSVWEKIACRSL